MDTILLRSASILALAAAALAANAAVIDFENLGSLGTTNGTFRSFGNAVASGGYTFTDVGTNGLYAYDNGNFGSFIGNYTGSYALFNQDNNATIGMSKTGGGAFDLTSLQVANVVMYDGTRTLTFVGTHPDGTTVSQSTTLTIRNNLTTISLAGFTNLASVALPPPISGGPNVQFDNIVVNATPEPSALAALALGALALLKRRKRA